MSDRIRVGIIGAGGIAHTHARAYGAFPEEAQIVAFADIHEETARRTAGEFGVDSCYTDYHEMLARDDIDLVSVCTPPFEHARNSIDALNAGKHVLCEKPMAGSLQECDAMLDAARSSGRSLSQVFQWRYRREVLLAKALIDEGKLGRVFFGKMDLLWWRGPHYYDLWWRGTWGQGVRRRHHQPRRPRRRHLPMAHGTSSGERHRRPGHLHPRHRGGGPVHRHAEVPRRRPRTAHQHRLPAPEHRAHGDLRRRGRRHPAVGRPRRGGARTGMASVDEGSRPNSGSGRSPRSRSRSTRATRPRFKRCWARSGTGATPPSPGRMDAGQSS